MSSDRNFSALREQVARACRELAEVGLVQATAGNVSVRHEDVIAITSTGLAFSDAVPEDVVVVTLDGEIIEGLFAPTSELQLHLGAYRRAEVSAVVHTHAPAMVAVTLIAHSLPCVHYQQIPLGGDLPCIPFSVFGSAQLAEDVGNALIEKNAVLMAHHGGVTVGADLAEAVANTHLLEWACNIYLKAAAITEPRALSEEQQMQVLRAALESGYGSRQETKR